MIGRVIWLVASAALALGILRCVVAGSLPPWAAALLAPAALLVFVVGVFQARAGLGQTNATRPLHRRHGFWVVVAGTLVGLPALGAFGLVDPWETHYAEVAREMIERRDFISPWWANEGWFMSKPVLLLWLEALSMVVLGVGTGPDRVLAGGAHPEWAVRFPGFALALVGAYLLYAGVARTSGRRAGAISAFVLWTTPGFALLSHQAITDSPLVGCVAASLGLLLAASSTDDAVRAPRAERFAVVLFVAVATLPQIAMLLLRHVHVDGYTVHLVADRLVAGSPRSCGFPGQPACAKIALAHPRLSPFVQATIWTPIAGWLLLRVAAETRRARLFALAAWAFASLAAMAKGPVGLVIPAAAALALAVERRSLRGLLRLEIPVGLALAVTMIGPWYLAAYARHGRVFIDELVFRHMIGRTLDHLHDTNDGEDVGIVYFVRQLAYATFPWSGIAAIAVLGAVTPLGRRAAVGRDPAATRAIMFGAAVASFALVSAMRTKFHHYVLVALPAIAALAGTWIDGITRRRPAGASAAIVAAACGVAVVGGDVATVSDGSRGPAHFILLLTYRYARAWPSTLAFASTFAVFAVVLSLVLITAGAAPRIRAKAFVLFGAGAFVLTAVLVGFYLPRCARDGGQRDLIAAYYAARAPDDASPLVAYQLNWKGENFYTGNHVAIFVSSGPPLKTYLARRKDRGERTVFFVTERGRVSTLKRELGEVTSFAELTEPGVSSEFTLVRAVL